MSFFSMSKRNTKRRNLKLLVCNLFHWFNRALFQSAMFVDVFFPLSYFIVVGVVSSDVSRSSCTTSFTPCCSVLCHSCFFFLMLSMYCILGRPLLLSPASFRKCMSSQDSIIIIYIVSACMSKESHFSFNNLGKAFMSCFFL